MRVNLFNSVLGADGVIGLDVEKTFKCTAVSITEPCGVVSMMRDLFSIHKKTEEYVYLLCLNTKGVPVGIFEVSHGTLNASFVSVRDTFKKALLLNAASMILVHNHPSGNPTPSVEDKRIFDALTQAGELMDIKLLDSLIIGNLTYYSFCEKKEQVA